MESKVLLYDSNNVKIGETFARRARQLVKQQRASWVGDNHEAIRFAHGMENVDDTMADDMYEGPVSQGLDTDNELWKLARKRVHAKFAFKLHYSIVLVVCALNIVIYLLTDRGGYFWPIWPMLGLGLSVIIHGIIYKMTAGNSMSNQIAREYEQLKFRHSYADSHDRRS
ncbi:MAG: 2TM domain-containing protein [Defluviitaleaceae bacterium]|nr:2TM domain-containing protein [Defluviitaleaceae bacterium]